MAAALALCRRDDVPALLQFLHEHWKANHVFTASRLLLDWQHASDDGTTYSFVLARRQPDGDIIGLLGFLPTRRFDAALAACNTFWLTLWKVRDDAAEAGLGLRLLQFAIRLEPASAIGTITPNPGTQPLFERLGYRVGELSHYVLPNPGVPHLQLAIMNGPRRPRPGIDRPLEAIEVSQDDFARVTASFDPSSTASIVPRKSVRYIVGRYLQHPIYRYHVYALMERGTCRALLVTRVAEHDGRRALRIVDFVGAPEHVGRSGAAVETLVGRHDAEYADVFNAGIDAALFDQAGFLHVDPSGPMVVPDHFEPFERRNIRLWFSVKADRPPILFKGDADQDRPGRVG